MKEISELVKFARRVGQDQSYNWQWNDHCRHLAFVLTPQPLHFLEMICSSRLISSPGVTLEISF